MSDSPTNRKGSKYFSVPNRRRKHRMKHYTISPEADQALNDLVSHVGKERVRSGLVSAAILAYSELVARGMAAGEDIETAVAKAVDRAQAQEAPIDAVVAEEDARTRTVQSLGFTTSEGRRIAVEVEPSGVDGEVLVSDAGESWSELVMAGYASPKPTEAERGALERVCGMHKVAWDAEACAVVVRVPRAELKDAVERVTAAALAIDGWRAWYPEEPGDEPGEDVAASVEATDAQ